MNNKRLQDLNNVFDSRWKANNYRYNGVEENIKNNNEHFNRMYNIKSREEKKQEIMHANSVDGRLENLNNKMSVLDMYKRNNNNFR